MLPRGGVSIHDQPSRLKTTILAGGCFAIMVGLGLATKWIILGMIIATLGALAIIIGSALR